MPPINTRQNIPELIEKATVATFVKKKRGSTHFHYRLPLPTTGPEMVQQEWFPMRLTRRRGRRRFW